MRSDVPAGLATEMAKTDYTVAFSITAEDDALDFSLISGASATNNRCGHDAKAYTYSGTGYVFRARATDAGALEIQRLTQADILAGTANYGAWTTLLAAANVAPGRFVTDKMGLIAVAADDSGNVQVFYFTYPAGGLADLKVGVSAAGGDPVGAWNHTTIVSNLDEDALMVAACQVNEAFYTERYTRNGETHDRINRAVYVAAWSTQAWTLDGRYRMGKLGRSTTAWGEEAWGGLGCVKHSDDRVLIVAGALHGKAMPGEAHIRGVATFWFSPGSTFGGSGAWYEGEWISPAHYTGDCLQWDIWARACEVNDELWAVFRQENEPTDTLQTEGSETVTRTREVVYCRSKDGVHWEEPKLLHTAYRVAGSGPVIYLSDADDWKLYCFTYENIYRSEATSLIGVTTNTDVQTDLGDYVKLDWSVHTDSRGAGRSADLTVQRSSGLTESVYERGKRITIEAGAVVSGSPSTVQIFTGHVQRRDGRSSLQDRVNEVRVNAIAGKGLQDTRSRDRVSIHPQEQVLVEETTTQNLVPQLGEWNVSMPSWLSGYKLTCGTWPVLEEDFWSATSWQHLLYPYAYVTKKPALNGGIEATVRLVQKTGIFGVGDAHQKSCAVGLLARGNPLSGDFMFVYENETVTRSGEDVSYGSPRLALLRREYTGKSGEEYLYTISVVASTAVPSGWQNDAQAHRMKMVVHQDTIFCYYKTQDTDTTWTLAFSYQGNELGAGYFGLVGRRANRIGGAGAETNKPWWYNVRVYDGEIPRTLEWDIREVAARGAVHDFRFDDTIADDMSEDPAAADWRTGTADGTWVTGGDKWTGSGVAVNRLLSLTAKENFVCDLEMEVHATQYAGLVARATDEDNYIALILTSTNAALYEMTAAAGANVEVQPLPVTLPTGTSLLLRFCVEEYWFSVWLGHTLLATFYYEYGGSGYVGLMTLTSGIFDDIRIPELTEVPGEMIIEIGQSMAAALRRLIRSRWVRWFIDHDGKLRCSYFSSRSDLGTIQERLSRTEYRERDDYVDTIRVEGADKQYAEYTYSGLGNERRFDVVSVPELRTRDQMEFWAERMAKTAAELCEQEDFEGYPNLAAEPEDSATIVSSADGVNGSYVLENITLRPWPFKSAVGTRQVVV